MIKDNPLRVGDYDETPIDRAAYDISEDQRMDNDWLESQHTECRIYGDSLTDSREAIIALAADSERVRNLPLPEDMFVAARRLNEDEALLQRALNSMYKTASALPYKHLLPKGEK